jgi:hypothetical protein
MRKAKFSIDFNIKFTKSLYHAEDYYDIKNYGKPPGSVPKITIFWKFGNDLTE